MQLLSPSVILASLVLGVFAQDTPIVLDGDFEGATATNESLYNTGGTILINGWSITVPENLQVAFPAAFVPWKDFVSNQASFLGMELSLVGNIVNGQGAVAAQISCAQFLLEISQGYIAAVNFDGTMQIASGPVIRINDPNAVYSVGYTAAPLFTADDQNPSVCSFSGFPMCVPRNATDPLCPASNRPTTPGSNSKQGILAAPNPLVMAPFVVGDFIQYSGFRNGAGEIVCYSIVATNIQITTKGTPAYIRVEEAQIGISGNTAVSAVGDTRFVGFTSDPNAGPISIFAQDIDVCTGTPTSRLIAVATIAPGAANNKFDFRFTSTAGDRYTREYLFTTSSGTKLTANGILAGQYVQPVTAWVQPEQLLVGAPPLPNDFSAITYLTQGVGLDDYGNIWGPLTPFPQSGVSVFNVSTCATGTTGTTGTTTSSTATPTPTKDTVQVVSASWISSGGGTLSVTCQSSTTDNTKVGMVLNYIIGGTTTAGVTMTATSPGLWTFSNKKIKQPSTVTCRSNLGGSATGPVS